MTSSIRKAAYAAFFVGVAAVALASNASAQERHFRFAYDQPKTTGYGVVGDIFAAKMKELSKGQFLVDQYPGAQLGQEPQVLQLLKSGDIDFAITSSANTATFVLNIAPPIACACGPTFAGRSVLWWYCG